LRRGLVVAVLLCLAGAGLLLLALSRTWLVVDTDPLSTLLRQSRHLSGATLAPGARALGLVGLAGVAALPATRSWGRLLVGALLAAAGIGAALIVTDFLRDPSAAANEHVSAAGLTIVFDPGAAPYVALLGALLLLAAGVLTLVRGRSWSALGSSYDAPTAPKGTSAWDALDHGVDPTA
jgi:uncharacterized membrane protein (TIGR02234 family)